MPKGARVLAPSAARAAGQMYTDAGGMQDFPESVAMTAKDLEEAKRESAQVSRSARP